MVLVSHDRKNVHEQLNRKRKEEPNSVDEEEVIVFNISADSKTFQLRFPGRKKEETEEGER